MSNKIHTCYTQAEFMNTLECNSECEDIELSKIGTLDKEDHTLYENDISKTNYAISEPNLYAHMIVDHVENDDHFDPKDDIYFEKLNEVDAYQSQKSINLLQTDNSKNKENNTTQDEQEDDFNFDINDIETNLSFQGNICYFLIIHNKIFF